MTSSIVKIEEGHLQGTQRTNFDGEKFHAFLNIPFAKPPLGKLRFKAPEPVEPWTNIRNAAKEGNICMQQDNSTLEIKGSEDCLNLHVYTRTLPSEENKLKPVMVYIHGGAFKTGSNETALHGPEYLLTEDIVLVIPNYRLGIYGFVYFNDPSLNVPGNAGLKDQRLAIQWVQRNIRSFNGNPNNVTIFGESAGAASVHCHLLSPSTKGLFHRAILLSGTMLSPRPYRDETCMQFVRKIQPNIDTEAQALQVLQQLSTEELLQYQEKFCKENEVFRIFGPTIEYPNETAFLASHPGKLIVSGQYHKIPLIFGYCDREGLLLTEVIFKSVLESGLNLDDFIHPDMELQQNDPNRLVIKKKLADLYLQPPYIDKTLLFTDYEFIAGIIGSAKIHAKASSQPVYLYRISIDAGLNKLKKMNKLKSKGVCHADDMGYLFYMDEVSLKNAGMYRGDIEITAMRRFVKLLTNFAKTSDPTPPGNDLKITWKPVDQNEVDFLDLNTELTLHTNPEADRMKVWKEIFQLSPNTITYI